MRARGGRVTLHVLGEGTRGGVGAVHARAVVLATGGIGQIYAVTTNPPVSTGDGVAAALRAGARLRDIEFIQFHPTVLTSVRALAASCRLSARPYVARAASSSTPVANASWSGSMSLLNWRLAMLSPNRSQEMAADGVDHVYVDGGCWARRPGG